MVLLKIKILLKKSNPNSLLKCFKYIINKKMKPKKSLGQHFLIEKKIL